jgi:alpha-galactosidase
VVRQYNLDLLEHDQPMILDQCIRDSHGHRSDDPVDVSRSAAEGYYWVYDELRKEFPDLLFENCVNGGRIVDFGVVKRAHYTCATDVYDPLSLRRTFYDTSYPLPPCMIELYIEYLDHEFVDVPKHTALTRFKSLLRSAMLGWCTIMIDTNRWDSDQHEVAKREFTVYKEKLRPLIAGGNLYHVFPRPDGERWDGIQYHDPGTDGGALMVFRPDSDQPAQEVVLRGLDTGRTYSIVAMDGSVAVASATGRDLMTSGLRISLPQRNSSDIILLSQES